MTKTGCSIGCIVLVLFIVASFPLWALPMMLIMGAERTVYERTKSPDGWHEARVQFDDGGAVSGFERLVFIKHAWNVSDAPLLSCRAFWGHGQAEINLHWRDDDTLVIAHHVSPENIATTAANCGSIKIILQPTPPFEKF